VILGERTFPKDVTKIDMLLKWEKSSTISDERYVKLAGST
jgi:hypothetical protein